MKIPEGWKLVPIKPTREMRVAAEHEIERSAVLNYGAAPSYEDLWSWMLAAAPTPPAQEEKPVAWIILDWCGDRRGFETRQEAVETLKAEGCELIPLYTRPADDELRRAAEEVLKCFDSDSRYSVGFEVACEKLRAALEGK